MSASPNRATRLSRSALVLAAIMGLAGGCGLDVGVSYPIGEYDGYPSDGYLATTDPVYFDGRASYWYGGRWNYREGGRWGHYDREPAGLYQRRMQGAQGRHAYEPGHAHFAAHGGGGGGGGARGGGRR